MKFNNIFKIDPLKSFTELPVFWITIVSSLFLATLSAILIVANSNIVWSPDFNGFNSFIEIFKVPLSIMALTITIVAILATMHRSAQTREQILITNKQNEFSNYFKHVEEFEKYMKSTLPKSVIMENLRLTHKYLFPNAIDGNFTVNKDFLDLIENEFFKCKNLLKNFNQDEVQSTHKWIYEINLCLDNILSPVHIKLTRAGKRLNVNEKMITVPEYIKDFISDIKSISSILVQIITFDHLVKIPNSLIQMSNLYLSEIPDWNIFIQNNFKKFNVFKELD